MSFPRDLIIDPSLFTAENTYQRTSEIVEENYDILHFHIPESFLLVLEQYGNYEFAEGEAPPSLRFFRSYADLPPIDELLNTMQPLDIGRFNAGRYFETYEPIYQSLYQTLPYQNERQEQASRYDIEGDPLTDIIFEEYVFTQERSGLVSRLKKTINNLIEAGITVIEVSEEAMDYIAENHIKDNDQRKKSIAKAMGKWVAISGAGLAAGAIGGIPAAVASGGGVKIAIDAAFLLVFDP